jgi:cytochrome P450
VKAYPGFESLSLRHKSIFEPLKNDPALIPKVIEENLRHQTPTQWSGRNTTVRTVLGGVAIPAKSRVYLNWGSANRDAAKFPERPDQFDADREGAGAHLAFGFGPHFCIGSPLARLEIRITLELLVARLEDLRLAPGHVPHFHAHPVLRGIDHLPVLFTAG